MTVCIVCGGGCVSACVRACVRVPMFSNGTCIGLGYNSGVSRTILGDMIIHVYSIHGPCSNFQHVI